MSLGLQDLQNNGHINSVLQTQRHDKFPKLCHPNALAE